jgi:hypothetical protein
LGSHHRYEWTSIDTEDGSLGGAIFAWSSDQDGALGTGRELWASDLTTGTHRITLMVTDSDGYVGTDEVTVFVGRTTLYLPLILKSHR